MAKLIKYWFHFANFQSCHEIMDQSYANFAQNLNKTSEYLANIFLVLHNCIPKKFISFCFVNEWWILQLPKVNVAHHCFYLDPQDQGYQFVICTLKPNKASHLNKSWLNENFYSDTFCFKTFLNWLLLTGLPCLLSRHWHFHKLI